jgi:hypothetical protein
MWGGKIDLRHAYFHLELSPELRFLHSHAIRRRPLGVPGCSFWAKHLAPIVHDFHESLQQKMENTRHFVLHLPGRHFGPRHHSQSSGQKPAGYAERFVRGWNAGKKGLIFAPSSARSTPFRVPLGLKE